MKAKGVILWKKAPTNNQINRSFTAGKHDDNYSMVNLLLLLQPIASVSSQLTEAFSPFVIFSITNGRS